MGDKLWQIMTPPGRGQSRLAGFLKADYTVYPELDIRENLIFANVRELVASLSHQSSR